MADGAASTFFLPPADVRLPLFWAGMGEETQRTPDYRWHGLRRETQHRLLWQFTLRGEGMIEIGDHAPVSLHRGAGFLVRIPSDHCYYYRLGSPAWRFVWVIWSGPAVDAIADGLMGKNPVRLVRMNPETAEIRNLRSLVRLGSQGDPWRRSAEAYQLLLTVCQATTTPAKRKSKLSQTASKFGRLLKEKPSSAIGKKGLAAELGMSRFQLYRAMKGQLGVSPHEWAARQRIERACELLKTTRRSIADIAVESGIPDANYFARFFRERTGFSPRDWRRLFAINR